MTDAFVFDETLIAEKPKRGRPAKSKPKTVYTTGDTPPKLDEAIEAHLPKTPAARLSKDLRTIQEGLQQAFTFLGIGISMVNLYDAMVIHENAELLAKHWTRVAEQNPVVKKYLLSALQGGVWAGAITTSLAVVVPIVANHMEDIPDEIVGMTKTLGVSIPDSEYKDTPTIGFSSNGDNSTT